MGLFDTIRFEFEIPGRGVMHEWQTKSLECCMDSYLVTTDYHIYREEWDMEWMDDDRLFLKGHMQKIDGSYRLVPLTDFHGDVIFYDACSSCEYTARFSYGLLDNVTFKTRGRLNDEEFLHECLAVRQQGSCPRGKEWQERCAQSGVSPHVVYQVQGRKQVQFPFWRQSRAD
jgi:hypothetical protein